MKRFFRVNRLLAVFAAIVFLATFTAPSWPGQPIFTKRLISAETVAASGSYTSDAVDLHGKANSGFFAIQYTLTGLGAAKIEYLMSIDGVTYVEPSSASDIGTALAAGTDILSFAAVPGKYIKIKVTETGGVNLISITSLDIFIQ